MRVALILNVLFTIIEFIGGLYTNSIAILSDAIHDLGDSIAIGAALVLENNRNKAVPPPSAMVKEGFLPWPPFLPL